MRTLYVCVNNVPACVYVWAWPRHLTRLSYLIYNFEIITITLLTCYKEYPSFMSEASKTVPPTLGKHSPKVVAIITSSGPCDWSCCYVVGSNPWVLTMGSTQSLRCLKPLICKWLQITQHQWALCRDPESKYIRLCEPWHVFLVTIVRLCHYTMKASSESA
jgi:hypothetical protein